MTVAELKRFIRDVPDFPRPGILFRDITPLLASPAAFAAVVAQLAEHVTRHGAQGLVAVESRGFLFGAALAVHLGLPLIPVRKPGKLPFRTVSQAYALEYGEDRVEIHVDAIQVGVRYALIDDLIATGGTAEAAAQLVERGGGRVAVCAFAIELDDLGGRTRLGGRTVESLLRY